VTLPVEDQVGLLATILQSISTDVFDPEGELRKSLPCSFQAVTDWTAAMPNGRVHTVFTQAVQQMPHIQTLANFDPMALDQLLSNLDDADPRVPAFTAQLAAVWPSIPQIEGIFALHDCLTHTMTEIVKKRPELPDNLPVSKGIDEALGTDPAEREKFTGQLAAMSRVLDWLREVRPGVVDALDIAPVQAPGINEMFDLDGAVVASDIVSAFNFGKDGPSGSVQSRVWPRGEAGTRGEGWHPYLYRISTTSDPEVSAGIASFSLQVGPLGLFPFFDDGRLGRIFVIREGGVGSAAPTSARQEAGVLTVEFSPPLRADSYFFGFVSRHPPRSQTAKIVSSDGRPQPVECTSP
jgi:hypothetical protein